MSDSGNEPPTQPITMLPAVAREVDHLLGHLHSQLADAWRAVEEGTGLDGVTVPEALAAVDDECAVLEAILNQAERWQTEPLSPYKQALLKQLISRVDEALDLADAVQDVLAQLAPTKKHVKRALNWRLDGPAAGEDHP